MNCIVKVANYYMYKIMGMVVLNRQEIENIHQPVFF